MLRELKFSNFVFVYFVFVYSCIRVFYIRVFVLVLFIIFSYDYVDVEYGNFTIQEQLVSFYAYCSYLFNYILVNF